MTIAGFMHQHHAHCDELFAAMENVVHDGEWSKADAALASFIDTTEAHFRAEEEQLFPAFEQATGMVSGPTEVMRMEHRQMRALFDQMRSAAIGRDGEALAGAADTLLILMQQHNMKEENILYPMCDQAITSPDVAAGLRARLAPG